MLILQTALQRGNSLQKGSTPSNLIGQQQEKLIDYQPITIIIIHQIFSLVGDWSKRITWANIPQLKLGNIRGCSPIFKTDG